MKFKRTFILLLMIAIFLGLRFYVRMPNEKENQVLIGEEETGKVINPILEDSEEESNIEEMQSTETDEPEAMFAYNDLSSEVIERIMDISYKENDKIRLEDLAHVQVAYWGFDDKEHRGEIIVHRKVAGNLVEIFEELYEAKYPIEKIRLIDEYNASDDLSMSDNNTSAFCYREIAGSGGKISNHSYGIAIDINPVQNPYIKNSTILPPEGKEYLDRDNIRKGMITKGDVCYNAFVSRGWTWGGEWKSLKDYQHFEIILSDTD